MRISGVRTGVVGTPWRNPTVVEVSTDEGLTGVGEARMLNHTDAPLGLAVRDRIKAYANGWYFDLFAPEWHCRDVAWTS
jgi:L-alanine-DL-glutamate epimerase-like enolase superfamily enzyme